MADQHIDDKHLLQLISEGDEAALETLYSRYGSKLYGYISRALRDQEAAEDVLQESLLTVWQKAKNFRGEGRVIAWLFGIAHNKIMRTYREKRNHHLSELIADADSMESRVDDKLISQKRRKLLRAGLDKLSIKHRTVLELVFYQDMTMQEISKICKIPVGTVKSRLSYAKAALKGILSREDISMEDLI
jgi:RNA polymerase sigma-70 factor (ECF subfamily)